MLETFYHWGNVLTDPTYVTIGSPILLGIILVWRKELTKPRWAVAFFGVLTAIIAISMLDYQFRSNVTAPDNVPILALMYLVPFFTWLSLYKAVLNDERLEKGQVTWEEELGRDEVYVWPDLVYTELLCLIACTVLLVIWAIYLKAPLENPANPADSPNPSKAPWYFLGLQEMLVYFDPWIAGVVAPGMIIAGLCAIPYIDPNPKGNGYYCFKDRAFAVTMYLMGFVIFWVVLILIGTFLRGPNWNFFGPYEKWDVHKVEALNNVDLSDFVWVDMLNQPKPGGSPANILLRESPGFLLLAAYFVLLPPLLAFTIFRRFYVQMGPLRYSVMIILLLSWALIVIKMILRWTINLKYIVAIPEWFFNI